MSVTTDQRCRVCDKEIVLPVTLKPRYWCCNGTDCGCNGAVLPPDICSVKCGEQAEFDDNEELGSADLEEQLDSAFERADNR